MHKALEDSQLIEESARHKRLKKGPAYAREDLGKFKGHRAPSIMEPKVAHSHKRRSTERSSGTMDEGGLKGSAIRNVRGRFPLKGRSLCTELRPD